MSPALPPARHTSSTADGTSDSRAPCSLLRKEYYSCVKKRAAWLDRGLSCFCPTLTLRGGDLLTRFHTQNALALDLRRCRTIRRTCATRVTIGRALQQCLHLLEPRN